MTYRDANASDLLDCLDLTGRPAFSSPTPLGGAGKLHGDVALPGNGSHTTSGRRSGGVPSAPELNFNQPSLVSKQAEWKPRSPPGDESLQR